MNLDRFIGEGIHGFLEFNFSFNKNLTFLTGINGSGKTSVLNTIVALITPSVQSLGDLEYRRARIELTHNEKKVFVEASKIDNKISIICSEVDGEIAYLQYLYNEGYGSPREAEYQSEYYREIETNSQNNPVMRFITALPTPMLLGLDRRVSRLSVGGRRRPSPPPPPMGRFGRNMFNSLPVGSVEEAANLAETHSRDALIEVGRLAAKLQTDLLLELLSVKPRSERFDKIAFPLSSELNKLKSMRKGLEELSHILRLPEKDVHDRVIPFIDYLEQLAKKMPRGSKIEDELRGSNKNELANNLIQWSINSKDLERFNAISHIVAKFNSERAVVFETIDRYLSLVNKFLNDSGKELKFDEKGYICAKLDGVDNERAISFFSSGESQIFIILTHLAFNNRIKSNNVFIVDEPEISLHVQWQELLVDSMISTNNSIQYVIATHSPSIILDKTNLCKDITGRRGVYRG